ncbi:hypothetical protein G7Z17_g8603 [Cylindrodendrum hubeiense]|uniref:C3H1-type domain-containing protein n=1 Tax=Cylindrodendrum hubeiense TaxID=595255 RepID=A0A9P5H5K8_9HYPO|nr:hypothetical protein G7Z17_g8603 [Cylindrodendrum hubeiense]
MPPPRPLFFLVRPGLERFTSTGELIVQPGTIVPLIPIDLLPEWLDICGIPRNLQPEDTVGMTNLGSFHAEANVYRLKFIYLNDDAESQDQGEGNNDTDESVAGSPSSCSPQPPSSAGSASASNSRSKSTRRVFQGLASSRYNNPTPQRIASPRPRAASKKPAMPKGSVCRYWCHHGTCKWGTVCRYRHSMPQTTEELAMVGLTDFPDWWLASTGVLSIQPGLRDKGTHKPSKKQTQKKIPAQVRGPQLEERAPVNERGTQSVKEEGSEAEDPVMDQEEVPPVRVAEGEDDLIEF